MGATRLELVTSSLSSAGRSVNPYQFTSYKTHRTQEILQNAPIPCNEYCNSSDLHLPRVGDLSFLASSSKAYQVPDSGRTLCAGFAGRFLGDGSWPQRGQNRGGGQSPQLAILPSLPSAAARPPRLRRAPAYVRFFPHSGPPTPSPFIFRSAVLNFRTACTFLAPLTITGDTVLKIVPEHNRQQHQPLTPWELPSLLTSVHTYRRSRRKAKRNARTFLPSWASSIAIGLPSASQIQRRFADVLRSDRTARRHLEELESLGYLGRGAGARRQPALSESLLCDRPRRPKTSGVSCRPREILAGRAALTVKAVVPERGTLPTASSMRF